MQPIDSAWDVAKGEAFHPSVAGYMGRSKPSPNVFPFTVNRRIQRPTADFENRISGKDDGFEGEEERALASRIDDSQDVQRLAQGGNLGRRPASHILRRSSDSPIDTAWSVLKALSREDLEMASRTGGIPRIPGTMRPEFYGRPDYRYEQEPPVDMMTPLSPLAQALPTEPRFSGPRTEQADIQQQYNELIFPDEEAEHRRINAPTPVSMPSTIDANRHFLEQRLQDMRYPMAQMRAAGHTPETNLPMRQMTQDHMKLQHRLGQRPAPQPGAPMPVGEAGEASMDDPSQMEHLGRELADAHHEDIDPTADIPLRLEPPNFRTLQARAPNRTAYMQQR
jgi:hypothetical protein